LCRRKADADEHAHKYGAKVGAMQPLHALDNFILHELGGIYGAIASDEMHIINGMIKKVAYLSGLLLASLHLYPPPPPLLLLILL
jgi:hypothetical protein